MHENALSNETGVFIAHLNGAFADDLSIIRSKFKKNNLGYDLHFESSTQTIKNSDTSNKFVFIQTGGGTLNFSSGKTSKFSVGDIILLKSNESFVSDSLLSCLIIKVPEEPNVDIPQIIRPDWDENITDTPGGCATETNAYRRILLTWKKEVGNYVFHGLNAHRVRIMDSFSHYHPKIGGFDEFYLVQMAQDSARIITSNKVSLIENPLSVTLDQSKELLASTHLEVGDLVYIPRGTMHRGIGGVLAQVITVPGFIPGSEIGLDHQLKKINTNLGLNEKDQVLYNEAASGSIIIK